MKRFLSAALIACVFSTTTVGLVGCGEKAEVTKQETVRDAGGTTTTTETQKIESKGDNPPANSAGQTAETPK
jgi:hypothetical protein